MDAKIRDLLADVDEEIAALKKQLAALQGKRKTLALFLNAKPARSGRGTNQEKVVPRQY